MEFGQNTDFTLAATAMGVKGVNLGSAENPAKALKQALEERGPCVIDLPICESEMVFPMVPPGGANRDMIHKINNNSNCGGPA